MYYYVLEACLVLYLASFLFVSKHSFGKICIILVIRVSD